MSAVSTRVSWISPEEYLKSELLSDVRHEYFAGEVVAMAGASEAHNYIAGNIFAALHGQLRGKRCAPFMNDMKAHIHHRDDDWFYYPDVMVNRESSGQHKYYCDTASVIIEVLSPETEGKDRREKRLAYEMIATLRTYVLVAQEQRELTVFRRTETGWSRELLPEDGGLLRLPELEFAMPVDSIYERTAL